MIYQAEIIGKPAGQPRPRACIRGRHAGVYTPSTGSAAEWRELLLLHFTRTRPREPIAQPCEVSMFFDFERPKSHRRANGELRTSAPLRHSQAPDIDNLVKLVLDVLQEALVLRDDSLVYAVHASKGWLYGSNNKPGLELVIS